MLVFLKLYSFLLKGLYFSQNPTHCLCSHAMKLTEPSLSSLNLSVFFHMCTSITPVLGSLTMYHIYLQTRL